MFRASNLHIDASLIATWPLRRPFFSLDHAPYLSVAKADPVGFVAALSREVTVDEIQHAPGLLPAIKLSVDRDRRPRRFVLTGSANDSAGPSSCAPRRGCSPADQGGQPSVYRPPATHRSR